MAINARNTQNGASIQNGTNINSGVGIHGIRVDYLFDVQAYEIAA